MKYLAITGTLKAITAVHIGTGDSNELTDALIRRSKGKPYIPGTAIAGALRALLTRLAPRLGSIPCQALKNEIEERSKSCNCAVCNLLGDINPTDENNSKSKASRLLVFNAYQDKDVSICSMFRDGVGIDRATCAAARAGGVKFDLEVVPAGTQFKLRIELRNVDETGERLLAAALSEWVRGRLWLGGRVSRGLGSFELQDLQYKTLPLSDDKDLMFFLRENEPWQVAKSEEGWLGKQLEEIKPTKCTADMPKTVSRGWFLFVGTLQARGPLLTNDILSSSASGFDHAPALSRLNDWSNPTLPGSSLRGVIRSHAERIARTFVTINAKNKEDFLSSCPACDPNVQNQDKTGKLPLESCDSLLKKPGIRFNDRTADITDSLCLACRLFGSTRLGSRLIVEDATIKPVDNQSGPKYKMLDFLAIDRFTGGGVEGAKFDAIGLWQPAFNLKMFIDNPEPWELGWIQLVIRDLEEGWLSVGSGRAKGFGEIQLTDWTATYGYIHPEDAPSGLMKIDSPIEKNGVYTTKTVKPDCKGWPDIAQCWLDRFNNKMSIFQRAESIKLTTDNYFDGIKEIYCHEGGAS